jgi:anthranilate synthase component 1
MRAVPDLQSFRRLVATADTVPVYREIAADLDTPVSAFLKLYSGGPGFLLESVEAVTVGAVTACWLPSP